MPNYLFDFQEYLDGFDLVGEVLVQYILDRFVTLLPQELVQELNEDLEELLTRFRQLAVLEVVQEGEHNLTFGKQ